jgi:hypothetical protein
MLTAIISIRLLQQVFPLSSDTKAKTSLLSPFDIILSSFGVEGEFGI